MRSQFVSLTFGTALILSAFAGSIAEARPGGGFHGGAGGRGAAMSVHGGAGGVSRAGGANLNRGANANVNRGANVNRNANFNGNRNINANVNRNVNIDVDHRWDGGCCGYHPVAAGVAFGAAAAVTAAAIGSMVYTLPPACVTRAYPTGTYYSCGGVWYQPQYSGSQVTYVVVNNPG